MTSFKSTREGFFDGVDKAAANAPREEALVPKMGEAVQRHYQFSDLHNGSWYIEIVAGPSPILFFLQEVRNGEIVRRSREPQSFEECRKRFWNRAHQISMEAGHESPPPEIPTIIWSK